MKCQLGSAIFSLLNNHQMFLLHSNFFLSHFLENFYDGKEIIENSELYKFLYSMPKGGLLHYHLTAAAPIDFLLSLTQEDIVYYNREKNKISINKDDEPPEGYIQ